MADKYSENVSHSLSVNLCIMYKKCIKHVPIPVEKWTNLMKGYTYQPQWHYHYELDQISVSSHVYVYGQPNDPHW